MPIVVDPDNLDRDQVIFNTASQFISLYPVATSVISETTDGATSGTVTFTSATGGFTGTEGNILTIKSGQDAAHYTIETVNTDNSVDVATTNDFTAWINSSATSLVFEVFSASTGSILDGVTLQALYSFAKEEWRSDSELVAGDDLIRHQFPFEAITSEQFELGGGASHDDWTWFDFFTRKKVRTAGWADLDNASATVDEYTGIVTLGSLDSDTQVYYQQIDTDTSPTDFEFLGSINESIFVFSTGDDRRSFLKLFARKKARTYAGSSIADIGVTTIQTIVNRFPLTHAVDPAIVAEDAEILGSTPWRNQATLVTGTGTGDLNDVDTVTGTLTDLTKTFLTSLVVAGDTVEVTSGTQTGFFTILAVESETELTLDTTEFGGFVTESSISYIVSTTIIIASKITGEAFDITDGDIADVDTLTGTLTSATSTFQADGVAIDDLVIINDPSITAHNGVYKIVSVDSETQLTLNTSDLVFTTQTDLEFRVVEPGMYLQFKSETITVSSTGNLTFGDDNPDTITRATGDWVADGFTEGSVITIANTNTGNNNGSFTVAIASSLTLTLVSTDTVFAETVTSATVTGFDGFKREISGEVFAFNWRLFGNNALLSETYQFIQHQLRQSTDIDYGEGLSRGDVTDLLMTFSTPTGTALNLFIDDLADADINNTTYRDATGVDRNFPFTAAGSLNFNTNLQNDSNARYWLFFTNDDAGDNSGRDYGTTNAIIVNDADSIPIEGSVAGQPSVSFTYDYDGNIQRGAASAAVNAPVTLVAIGLQTAQFVVTTGTITRSTSISISAVAALERNYSNP